MILHAKQSGSGPVLLMLHGMAGSSRYWDGLTAELNQKYRVVSLDLLGFGRSPKPSNSKYDYNNHINSILETIVSLGLNRPVHLVGHSTGALLALRLAAENPELIKQLTLISMPVYTNQTEARKDITRGKRLKDLAYYGPSSQILCTTWCRLLRPISKHIAPIYLPGFPKHVAHDSLLHTWRSYSNTLHNVVMNQNVQTDMNSVDVPIDIIYGNLDSPLVLNNFQNLKLKQNAHSYIIRGPHNITIDNPTEIIKILLGSN